MKSKAKANKSSKRLLAVISCVVIILAVIAIIAGHIYFSSRWYINTDLNGNNVGGARLEDTLAEYEDIYGSYSLTIKGRENMSVKISKEDIDLEISSDDCIKKAFEKQHSIFYLFALLQSQELTASPSIEYAEEKFENIINTSVLVNGDETHPIIAPRDAGAEFSEEKGYFVVRPEIEGCAVNSKLLLKAAKDALALAVKEIDIDDPKEYPNMFEAPLIKAEGSGLKEICNSYNSTVIHWINWKLADGEVVSITPQDIMPWYDMDDNYVLTLNEQSVKDWTEQFCLKYKTLGKTRAFKAHTGNVINVTGGDYGWQMNYKATVGQILDVLNEDSSDKIRAYIEDNSPENKEALTSNLDVIYTRRGNKFNSSEPADDFDMLNYSEISIGEQKVYVFREGMLVYTANCITGRPVPERETAKGCWYIKEKMRNKTLVGEDYETPVSYWLRITWSGIGYHDAAWQNWAGWNPERYKSVGSHGCINLSLTDAAKIYELIDVGDPVFIY